ncbi:MAG: hypothetical protein OHK0032_15300 [Thermodesulfovibrionales bacterium]
MKNSLWVIIVIVAAFLGFLIGYSVSSYTGYKSVGMGAGAPAAGGYGAPTAGGYGSPAGAPAAGGYGAPAPAAPAAPSKGLSKEMQDYYKELYK